ncbi:MAG: hypothetical protein QOJ97_1305 [Solirubrobacteraceae bacterium]|jgi:hypothetical protein|nr:hypothetical protein [Solirubrobacteraceae bacterium]
MKFVSSSLESALEALGELLDSRGLEYRLAVVGGGAMLLLGLIERPTADLDVVAHVDDAGFGAADPLPTPLQEAIADVARSLDLPVDWLNPGPASLLDLGLPSGFDERAHVRRYESLEILLADRLDQIHFKLYAAVDQGPKSKHFADLQALRPIRDELLTAARWARTHDPSEGFRAELAGALQLLGVEVRDGDL